MLMFITQTTKILLYVFIKNIFRVAPMTAAKSLNRSLPTTVFFLQLMILLYISFSDLLIPFMFYFAVYMFLLSNKFF